VKPSIAFCLSISVLVATSGHSAVSPEDSATGSNCKPASISSAPKNTGHITDGAHIFSNTGRVKMLQAIRDLERAHRVQLAVVSVKSLAGQDVADFTCTLAIAWGVGDRDRDDGILILIAPNEGRLRIAVGFGLEEKLPNDFLKQIIDRKIMPEFPQKRYSKGIAIGIAAISSELSAP
jgi:uncharacterized protein